MSTKRKRVKAYTDGSCYPNPGPGGWGVKLILGDREKELSGAAENTTNNRMEMVAIIEAIKAVNPGWPIRVFTDSQYVLKGITVWVEAWKSNNWMRGKKKKKPVKNIDLWKQLDALVAEKDVVFHWVKGHNGDPLNEFVDELAGFARKNLGVANEKVA